MIFTRVLWMRTQPHSDFWVQGALAKVVVARQSHAQVSFHNLEEGKEGFWTNN